MKKYVIQAKIKKTKLLNHAQKNDQKKTGLPAQEERGVSSCSV